MISAACVVVTFSVFSCIFHTFGRYIVYVLGRETYTLVHLTKRIAELPPPCWCSLSVLTCRLRLRRRTLSFSAPSRPRGLSRARTSRYRCRCTRRAWRLSYYLVSSALRCVCWWGKVVLVVVSRLWTKSSKIKNVFPPFAFGLNTVCPRAPARAGGDQPLQESRRVRKDFHQ